MQYLLSFLEGVITFISPCLLPMLPIYISYFAVEDNANSKSKTVVNSMGFVLGFTIVFVSLGAFAGTVGSFLFSHKTAVNIVTGVIVIIFGLNFIGLLKIKFLNNTHRINHIAKQMSFLSAVVFGIVFSIGWTPCVGAFLGSALALASQQGSVGQGIIMLLLYSLGLGIPFVISALIIDKLKGTFDFIKRNYKVINIICGVFLVLIGIIMATGKMSYFISVLAL